MLHSVVDFDFHSWLSEPGAGAHRKRVILHIIRASLCTTSPLLLLDPPAMDLGRFDISKGPSNREGLDLGLFETSPHSTNDTLIT